MVKSPHKISLRFDALAVAAWISVGLLLLAQIPTSIYFGQHMIWPISTIGLASCLALSELRRRRAEDKIHYLQAESTTDPLTGVGNRRWLDVELKQRMAQLRRQNAPFSALLVDIDHFKAVNDSLGHDAGDAILVGVAKELRTTLRDMDVLCRIGGEEFVVVLPGTESEAASLACERLRKAIESAKFQFNDKVIPVTVSIGLTTAIHSDTQESLLKRADEALYAAKRSGRNRCFIMKRSESRCNDVLDPYSQNHAPLETATVPC